MAKIALDLSTNKKYLIRNTSLDFHTSSGTLNAADLKKTGRIKSNKGTAFYILPASPPDYWDVMFRGPQILIAKDIGLIIARTGLNHTYKVLDAGGGSGSLCLSLANIARGVVVYETNPDHYDIINRNISSLEFSNVTLKQQDIYSGIDETGFDLITLDLPEPHRVLPHLGSALKGSGHLVVYLPNLTQAQQFISHLSSQQKSRSSPDISAQPRIKFIEMIELLERHWKIDDKILRPEFDMLGHTGFLIFCRKW